MPGPSQDDGTERQHWQLVPKPGKTGLFNIIVLAAGRGTCNTNYLAADPCYEGDAPYLDGVDDETGLAQWFVQPLGGGTASPTASPDPEPTGGPDPEPHAGENAEPHGVPNPEPHPRGCASAGGRRDLHHHGCGPPGLR